MSAARRVESLSVLHEKNRKNLPNPDFKDNLDNVLNQNAFRASSLQMLRSKYDKQVTHENSTTFSPGAKRVLKFMFEAWITGNFCDLYFYVEEQYIPAHKVAVASYSQFLADLLCKYPKGEVVCVDMHDFAKGTVMLVLTFVYTTDIDISDNNVEDVLACSLELGIEILTQLCKTHLSRYDATNMKSFFKIARRFELNELMLELKPQVYQTLQDVVEDTNFEEITSDELVIMITSSEYRKTELEIFQAIVAWIDMDRKNRMQFARKLLEHVRFSAMTPDVMAAQVETHTHIFDPQSCYKLLYEGMK